MRLFSDTIRTYPGPKHYAEPSFEYLDRSARLECERIRAVLEQWYSAFPDDCGDLAARFRDANNAQFGGATFELYIHRLLLGLGYTLSVHPGTGTVKKNTPDFGVSDNRGGSFYLEATLATDRSEAERASEIRKAVVYDSIERVSCPNFYLALDVEGEPSSAPSGRRLRASLRNWLDNLNPDILLQQAADFESLPRYTWEHEGWKITFTAVPRSPERRGSPQLRVIGSLMPEAQWIAAWQSLCKAIKAKGKRYGKLGKAFVIAVNATSIHVDRIDEVDALFGQESYVISRDNLNRIPRLVRKPNGVWYGPQGMRNKRISAVLIAKNLQPWTLSTCDVTLYLNPCADYPLSGEICSLARAVPQEDGRLAFVSGIHPREYLGLPQHWPGSSADRS